MLACSYKWSAVRAFHAKVLRSIEMGLITWGDSFENIKQPFFISTSLLDDSTPKTRNAHSRLATAFTNSPSIPCHQICDDWSWHATCDNSDCPKQHVCVVCKQSDNRALSCRKLKFPVPPCRQDPPQRDGSRQHMGIVPPCDPALFDPCNAPPCLNPSLTQPPCLNPSTAQPPTPRSSTSPRLLPIKSALTSKFILLHAKLRHASDPNASTLCIAIPSNLKIPEWWSMLADYPDRDLCDLLEFGWLIGYASSISSPQSSHRNHGSAHSSLQIITYFLSRECKLGATCGPFSSNLASPLVTSPGQNAYGHSGKPRVVIDLSFPPGQSVNSGIPSDTYLGEPFNLRLPGIDALINII